MSTTRDELMDEELVRHAVRRIDGQARPIAREKAWRFA